MRSNSVNSRTTSLCTCNLLKIIDILHHYDDYYEYCKYCDDFYEYYDFFFKLNIYIIKKIYFCVCVYV